MWIDGHYIRTHVVGFTTWDCDITDYVIPGESVTLTVGVADLEVTVQLRMKSERAGLMLELLDRDNNIEASGEISFVREESMGDSELSSAKKITIPVTKPAKWDAEHPNLYTLRSTLTVGGKTIQVNQEKIGFREIHYGGREGTDRNKVYVNGKEVKLRGTCRHDVSDALGGDLWSGIDDVFYVPEGMTQRLK